VNVAEITERLHAAGRRHREASASMLEGLRGMEVSMQAMLDGMKQMETALGSWANGTSNFRDRNHA
jgi:hypothetical protein